MIKKSYFMASLCLFTVLTTLSSYADWVPTNDNDLPLGYGVRKDTLEQAHKGFPNNDTEVIPGSPASFVFTELEEYIKQEDSCNFGSSLKAGFGFGKMQANLSRSMQSIVNKYSTYIVVESKVDLPGVRLKHDSYGDLVPEAKTLLGNLGNITTDNVQRFKRQYGEGFIHGIRQGASFKALIEIHTETEQQKRDLQAKLSGKAFSVKLNADLNKEIQELVGETRRTIYVQQSGGTWVNFSLSQFMEIADNAQKLIDKAQKAADNNLTAELNKIGVVSVDILPWENVFGGEIARITPGAVELVTRTNKLTIKASQILNSIEYVSNNMPEFTIDESERQNLQRQSRDITNAKLNLLLITDNCQQNPISCTKDADILSLNTKVDALERRIQSVMLPERGRQQGNLQNISNLDVHKSMSYSDTLFSDRGWHVRTSASSWVMFTYDNPMTVNGIEWISNQTPIDDNPQYQVIVNYKNGSTDIVGEYKGDGQSNLAYTGTLPIRNNTMIKFKFDTPLKHVESIQIKKLAGQSWFSADNFSIQGYTE